MKFTCHPGAGAPVPVFDKQNMIAILFHFTEELLLPSSSLLDDTEESELTGAELDNKMSPLNRTSNTAVCKVNDKI